MWVIFFIEVQSKGWKLIKTKKVLKPGWDPGIQSKLKSIRIFLESNGFANRIAEIQNLISCPATRRLVVIVQLRSFRSPAGFSPNNRYLQPEPASICFVLSKQTPNLNWHRQRIFFQSASPSSGGLFAGGILLNEQVFFRANKSLVNYPAASWRSIWNTASVPDFKIFIDAWWSLCNDRPHTGQSCWRWRRSFFTIVPQPEHIWEVFRGFTAMA